MKISLITTIYNEEAEIRVFLKSIKAQTFKNFELIIVDGGAKDNTVRLVKSWISVTGRKFKAKILVKRGNRSVGRNYAIKQAKGDIIVVTDAGCILDSAWLENITLPFKDEKVDVVAGFYKPKVSSIFEKCLATYTCVMADRVDAENFLPSSRSVAFRESAWGRAGGYPENLDTCEDLVFDKRLKKAGLKFKFAKNAFVLWPQRRNYAAAAVQFFNYAVGDGQALYIRTQTPFLFGRYILGIFAIFLLLKTKNASLGLLLAFILLAYIFWAILKNYKYVKKFGAFFYLPLLQFTSDIAVILGMTLGLLEHLMDN